MVGSIKSAVIGKVQMIISNTGRKGNGSVVSVMEANKAPLPSSSINGVNSAHPLSNRKLSKPQLRVRAKPLVESHDILKQEMF